MKVKFIVCAIVVCLLPFAAMSAPDKAENTPKQIAVSVDKILKDNPIPEGEKVQMIKLSQTDSQTLLIVRIVKDGGVKPHFHKTHDETVNVIKGKGKLLTNDEWVDIRPGFVHFNPKGNVHSVKNAGSSPLIVVSTFTPAMVETDRQFVE